MNPDEHPVASRLNSLWPSNAYMRRLTNQLWFREWLVAWSATSHYLNQCRIIANWTLAIIFQWKFNQNTAIFIEENAFENVVCEMMSISSRPQCVKMQQSSPYQENSMFLHNQKFRDSFITVDILKNVTGKTSPQVMQNYCAQKYRIK